MRSSSSTTTTAATSWLDDPNVLLQSPDLFPVARHTTAQRLNAVTRLILLIALAVFALTRRSRALLLGLGCAFGLAFLLLAPPVPAAAGEQLLRDAFVSSVGGAPPPPTTEPMLSAEEELAAEERAFLASVRSGIENREGLYQAPARMNPFGNLLQSDALLRPDRRPAPPLNTPQTREKVYAAMKEQVEGLHPELGGRLFATSADDLAFLQSLRPFFTNASTALIPDTNAAWRSMVPNPAAWRDGACRRGSKSRPRFRVAADEQQQQR